METRKTTTRALLVRMTMAMLALMCFPSGSKAQSELTVYEGTDKTSNYVPAYIYYFDDFTRSQFVIPDEDLVEMSGGTISAIKFYTTSSSIPYTTESTVDVYLKEVDNTTISAFEPKSNIVYQGTLDIVSEGSGGSLTIEFETPYSYMGGNLLIGIENTTDAGYKSIYFYGQEVTGASVSGSSGSSLEGVSATQRNFIPQTTFTYTPGQGPICPQPTSLTVEDITPNAATVNWESEGDTWELQYKASADEDWTAVEDLTDQTYNLTGLTSNTSYTVRVRTVCDANNSSVWKTASFTTPLGLPYLESFTSSSIPSLWNRYVGLLSDVQNGGSLDTTTYGWKFGTNNGVFDSHARLNIYGQSAKNWLVSPTLGIKDNMELTFDLALTAYSGTLAAPQTTGTDDKFVVLITTDGGITWEILRQWDNAGSEDVYNEITCSAIGEEVSINLSSYAGQDIAVAFYGESTVSNADNNLHIDNVSFDYISEYPQPKNLKATEITYDSAVLVWTENGSATAWQICLNEDMNNLIGVTGEATYTLSGLDENTTYTAKVRAVVNGEYSNWSRTIEFTTAEIIPRPTGLSSNSITQTTAVLQWSENGNATAWQICLNDDDNLILTTEKTYTLRGLTPETSYTVKVRAMVGEDYSAWSTSYNFTTNSGIPVPTDMTADNISDNSAVLHWIENGDATAWQIEYYVMVGNTTTIDVTENHYILEGLTQETEYKFRVRSLSGEEYSDWSSICNFTTDYVIPKPTQLTCTGITGTTATLSWTQREQEQVTSWEICLNKNEYILFNDENNLIDNEDIIIEVTENPYTLTGLTPETIYTAKVRAKDGDLTSNWSNITLFMPTKKIQIGSDNNINQNLPTNVAAQYSLSEQIYTTEELGEAGVILSIDFFSALLETTRDLDIYMFHTDKSTFSSNGNWVSYTDNDLVFSGTVHFSRGTWTTITLDNPFLYDGEHNVILVVDDNTGSSGASSFLYGFYSFNVNSNQALYSNSYNDLSIGGLMLSGNVSTSKSQIKILFSDDPIPTLEKPTNLECTNITGNSATLDWTESGEATTWQICLNNDEDNLIEVTEHPFTITGLTPETIYTAKVRAKDGEEISLWSNQIEMEVTNKLRIGTGTATNTVLPTLTNHNYSFSEQIYTTEELGEAGTILSIDFFSTATERTRNLDIYMIHTDKNSVSNTSAWVSVHDNDLVFSGEVTFGKNKWTTITLDNPFVYNGQQNVIIAVDDNTGSYINDPSFYVFETEEYQAANYFDNNTGFNPSLPPAGWFIHNEKNQIRLLKVRSLELADNGTDNSTQIENNDGSLFDVTLSGRTLWKDNSWNTLCLPFDIDDINDGTTLDGAIVKTLESASFGNGTLTLNFSDNLTAIEAGKPYIVKWETEENVVETIDDPVFNRTIIKDVNLPVETEYVDFIGIYDVLSIEDQDGDKTKLYIGADNNLYYPSTAMDINAFRAYFQLKNDLVVGADVESGINAFVLNIDGETTYIDNVKWSINDGQRSMANDQWYTIDGRQLRGKPTQKGIYIHNRQKVVLK